MVNLVVGLGRIFNHLGHSRNVLGGAGILRGLNSLCWSIKGGEAGYKGSGGMYLGGEYNFFRFERRFFDGGLCFPGC